MNTRIIVMYFKKEAKGLIGAAIVAIVIVVAAIIFLIYIGFPMTMGANYLNKGKLYLEKQQYEKAFGCFVDSERTWSSEEARDLIAKITPKTSSFLKGVLTCI
jgi:hypothetical protein